MIDKNPDFFAPAGAEVSIIPVMAGDVSSKMEDAALPLLALRNAVIFPGAIFPNTIGREKSMRLIDEAQKRQMIIGAVPQNDVSVEEPGLEDLFPYGTAVRIIKSFEMPDGTISAVLQGLKRFELGALIAEEPYLKATVQYVEDIDHDVLKKISNSLSTDNSIPIFGYSINEADIASASFFLCRYRTLQGCVLAPVYLGTSAGTGVL